MSSSKGEQFTFAHVSAVVGGFNVACPVLTRIVGIDVYCGEELADAVKWLELRVRAGLVGRRHAACGMLVQVTAAAYTPENVYRPVNAW